MPTRRLTFPAVAALALACVLLGTLAALAEARVTAPPPLPALPRCTPAKAPAAQPVPAPLLSAFAVLRRAAGPDDALPAEALRALRDRGLEPFDPAAARLVRRTADGGRAWVVPVRDVALAGLVPVPCVSRRPTDAPPAAPAPATPAPRTAPVPAPAPAPARPAPAPATPKPGLAVVALGGVPSGAGGRLEDLVRGRGDVAVEPCSGPGHDMVAVSGLVPDGVTTAFLTSPDGTAVRADVTDNAYTFVVAPDRRPAARYVVWTGGDGTPHVQPVGLPVLPRGLRCPPAERVRQRPPVVSPTGAAPCAPLIAAAPRPSRRPAVPVPVPAAAPCLVIAAPVLPAPAPRRPGGRHG
jgi:hypothetical protein